MARGTLRIYLGAAAGVGKTFAMLNEGRRRRDYGEDVVVGFVETHGREKTAEQVGDLEVVPRRTVAYRDGTFEEMDLDAILARTPQVALVDELAHTNVPGSRHEKRWEDVEELLNAGVSVVSTMNVQHLESLNDVVEQITGIKQRETIPDAVVRRADEIQLVDLTPLALRNRLARGDVYPAERIDTALANYFRAGNLTALRELALAWLADRVDEALAAYRERHGISAPWETRERILVALTGSTDGERLIRRAARIAQRSKGELVGVHVIPQDGLTATIAARLEEQRELLEELDGTYQEVVGADIGAALLETARRLNVTQIVMGASRRSKWQRLTRGAVIGRVIRESRSDIDVHVVSHPDAPSEDAFVIPRGPRPTTLPRQRVLLGFALGVVVLPLLTWTLSHLRNELGLTSVMLLYLLAVVVISAVGGLWPALAAAIVGSLLVNWYFVPPIHTFTIGEGENILAVFVFLSVAVVMSAFVALAARRQADGRRARLEAEELMRLAGSSSATALLESLQRVVGVEGAAVLHRTESGWSIEAASGDRVPESPEASSATIPLDHEHVLVLASPVRSEDQRVLDAFARELTASVELGELAAEAQSVQTLAAASELRAALLSAVSHDLRTPISAVKASVTSLLQQDVAWTEDERREFLLTIDEEADRLNSLVGNLLDMSRIQAGALEISAEPIGLEEVLPAALHSLGLEDGDVEVDVSESLPRVLADPGLLERALANVIQNAVHYSPSGEHARVSAGAVDGLVDVRVTDRGGGIPASERNRVFVPFQRLGDSANGEGVGLGLAVAKGFVEAMGGVVEVEDTPGGGLTIVFRLRAAE
jgi:two-component system, OmpR family, sensor histidine kinase KdpD